MNESYGWCEWIHEKRRQRIETRGLACRSKRNELVREIFRRLEPGDRQRQRCQNPTAACGHGGVASRNEGGFGSITQGKLPEHASDADETPDLLVGHRREKVQGLA